MPLKKIYKAGAMFDVKPVDETGKINLQKVTKVSSLLNLRSGPATEEEKVESLISEPEVILTSYPTIETKAAVALNKETLLKELESELNSKATIHGALMEVGAKVESRNHHRPRYKPVVQKKPEDKFKAILANINIPYSSGVPTLQNKPKEESLLSRTHLPNHGRFEKLKTNSLESKVENFYTAQHRFDKKPIQFFKSRPNIFRAPPKKLLVWIVAGIAASGSIFYLSSAGVDLKSKLISDGNSAIQNLESASRNIEFLQFASASYDLERAYQDFAKAGSDLNFLGASIGSWIAELPGASKLKSAQKIIEAGKEITNAGRSMANALNAIAQAGSLLDPSGLNKINGEVLGDLNKALAESKNNLVRADKYFAEIDEEVIPEDKKDAFLEFKSKLPQFIVLTQEAIKYSNFLEDLMGDGTRKYLLLFQNDTELRPTGGFPGSYGVVTFADGKLKEFFVDDIYNLDGQLKENIVPPKQLQHIAPIWGMRDANWFIDFPTSAKKVSSFFKKEAGYEVDGVITINPRIVQEMLGVLGSVQMPEYGLTLTQENFLTTIQDQVEYKGNRAQPKKILVDFAPKFLEKMYSADSGKWLEIFNILVSSLEQKNMLMYFKDLKLEQFAIENGFGGQVQTTPGDYLMVTATNVKGSKTDYVTDTSLAVSSNLESSGTKHQVTITREHNGGSSKFGFYNKTNPAYIRVLVPQGSQLTSIKGNAAPNYQPIVGYGSTFQIDSQLALFENSGSEFAGSQEVTIYQEAGKTEFGFWLITKPGETKSVTFEYTSPYVAKNKYDLLVQKQPGLRLKNFEFILDPRDQYFVTESSPTLSQIGEVYSFSDVLEKDLRFMISIDPKTE